MSRKAIFWDVDTQVDFMSPDGKLYVPGAEKIVPNLARLAAAARDGRVLMVSTADAHTPEDEEFREWPPHCVSGTPGQERIPETRMEKRFVIPNQRGVVLPDDLFGYQQIVIEKQQLDGFTNPYADSVVERLGREPTFVVFGVVTEYCVHRSAVGLLARGRRVALVTDAIQTLKPEDGRRALDELTAKRARLITTEQALEMV